MAMCRSQNDFTPKPVNVLSAHTFNGSPTCQYCGVSWYDVSNCLVSEYCVTPGEVDAVLDGIESIDWAVEYARWMENIRFAEVA